MKAAKIYVYGVVQGVGFRPFVYRIACQTGVNGYVKNLGGSGVELQVEGDDAAVAEFLQRFQTERPAPVIVERLEIFETKPMGYSSFTIFASDSSATQRSMIPPDFATCGDCINEVLTNTRWFNYPFNSCAFCGPRFSIIRKIPYDRENTSMADFPLCDECSRDYSDAANLRRFHAQGICCPKCGPQAFLLSNDFSEIDRGNAAVAAAAKLVDEGFVVAVKGVGGYHLAASATNDEVLLRLRNTKKRPSKPFAVMARDVSVLEKIVDLDQKAVEILMSTQRPILLLPKKNSRLSDLVAPGLDRVGVFLPYTALHYLFLKGLRDGFCVMTSGNPVGEPMVISDEDAKNRLSSFADYFLVHNRRIVNRVDDSVLRFSRGRVVFLRRGRGYAPTWIRLPFAAEKPVVALGAMLQNSACILFEDKAVLTPYVGDCDEYFSLIALEKNINFLLDCYKIPRDAVTFVCDLHPSYPTTRLAEEWARRNNAAPLKVQHHVAHVASAMADNGLDEEVVGIAVDGVGFGEDGTAWGGEVLRTSFKGYVRVGGLRPQPMPGGDAAAEYPTRMLLGILSKSREQSELLGLMRSLSLDTKGLPRGKEEAEFILKTIHRCKTVTSSVGRVYDAAAALLNICFKRTYEGEPAMKLEASAKPTNDRLDVEIVEENIQLLDTTKLIEDAVELLFDGVDRGEIAFMIQHAVGYGLGKIARKCAGKSRYVVVSGGAAVNEYFLQGVEEALEETSLEMVLPTKVPANDGGIALGQAAVAARQIE